MKIAMISLNAEPVGEVELDDSIFAQKPRVDILQRMVKSQLAARRSGTHQTKTRAHIKGSTRKIMRQKGSGGARHGTRKVNLFRGGGQAHGPHPRDYGYRLPKKVRRLALRSALSARALNGRLVVLDKAESAAPKTAALSAQLAKIGLASALIVDHAVDRNFALSLRNIPNIHMLPSAGFECL